MTDTPTPKRRPVTDDEVLEWWGLYADAGLTIGRIATIYDRSHQTILRHFRELGIFEPSITKKDREDRIPFDKRLLDWDMLTADEMRLAQILGGIREMREQPRDPAVAVFNSVQHFKRGSFRHTMSRRQRMQEAQARPFRDGVRADMKRAGIL